MDKENIKNTAEYFNYPGSLITSEIINKVVNQLINKLNEIIEMIIPKRGKNPSKGGPSEKYWDYEIN